MARYQNNYTTSFIVQNMNSTQVTLYYTISILSGSVSLGSYSGSKVLSEDEQTTISDTFTYQYDEETFTPGNKLTMKVSCYCSASGWTTSDTSTDATTISGKVAS